MGSRPPSKGQGPISRRLQIVAPNPTAGVHRSKSSSGVLQNRDSSCAGPVDCKVIQLAAVIVVKGKGLFGGRQWIVGIQSLVRSDVERYRDKGSASVLQNREGLCAITAASWITWQSTGPAIVASN
jgi:hypothetical protein